MRRIDKFLALFLSVAMLLSAIPLNVFAVGLDIQENDIEDQEESLSDKNGFQYNILEDGTVEICGYQGTSITDLTIPGKIDGLDVTQLAEEAFAYNETLKTIVIPASVKNIGNSAFYHCSALKAIVFEGEITNFGFTIAEGSVALEKVFCLGNCDISTFCALLISDMGEDVAKGIEILKKLGER